MYREEISLSRKSMIGFAVLFTLIVGGLIALAILIPRLPLVVRLVIVGAALLQATIGVVLIAMLSQVRITVDDTRLTVSLRLLVNTRVPLRRIVTCTATDWRGWGSSYRSLGMAHHPPSESRNAVWLSLTDGAQVLFTSRQPDAVCAALHDRQPAIELRPPLPR